MTTRGLGGVASRCPRLLRWVGRQGERRWPMAAAVVSVGVLQELVPDDFRVLPRFVYPIFCSVSWAC